MSLNETLVAQWLAKEMISEQLVRREGDTLVFDGERHTYLVELKVHALD